MAEHSGMDFLLHLLLAVIVVLLVGLLLRSRRRHDRAFNQLPTGICGITGDRIDHRNWPASAAFRPGPPSAPRWATCRHPGRGRSVKFCANPPAPSSSAP